MLKRFASSSVAVFGYQILIAAGFFGAWQYASGRLIKPLWISSPLEVSARLNEWIADGYIWVHLWTTLSEMLIGFAIGAAAGIASGLLLGVMPTTMKVISPLLTGLYAMPKVALAPLFILFFGIDLASKVALVAATVYFLVFQSTLTGMREVDPELVDTLRLMGATPAEVFRKVMIPSATLWVFNGLRISVRYALTAAVYGEIIASNQGLGFLVSYSRSNLDAAGTFAALAVLMLIGLTLTLLVARIELYAMRWKL